MSPEGLSDYGESVPGVVVGVGERIPMRVLGIREEGLEGYGGSGLSYDKDRLTVYDGPGEDANVVPSGIGLDPSRSYEFWVEGKAVGAAQLMTFPIDRLVAADYATVNVVDVQLEIDGSTDQTDHLFSVDAASPARARLVGLSRWSEDFGVVISNEAGGGDVEFALKGSSSFADTLSVELDPKGAWTEFDIKGSQISTEHNDTIFRFDTTEPNVPEMTLCQAKGDVYKIHVTTNRRGTSWDVPETTLLRDEIFEVKIWVEGPQYTGTMNLVLSQGQTSMNLPGRGVTQMYDFGYDTDADGDIDPMQTQIKFVATDNNTKTFRAVINIAQQVVISVTDTKNNGMTGKTDELTIEYRIRQYAERWRTGANPHLNEHDQLIVNQVAYWNNWHLPNPPEAPYTFSPDITDSPDMMAEIVKAVIFKESSMLGTDVMSVTGTAIAGMTPEGERDWNWSAEPIEEGEHAGYYELKSAPRMNYSGVSDQTPEQSIRWGIRWLYAKHTRKVYNNAGPHAGYFSDPVVRSWVETFDRYNAEPDNPEYGSAVNALWQSGRNIRATDGQFDPDQPRYLWPILTNGRPRDE